MLCLLLLYILGDIPVIRYVNQISDMQAWIMGVNVTRKIVEKRRDVKAEREEEEICLNV
mgnify:CR=1 FL=1